MRIADRYRQIDGEEAWKIVVDHIGRNKTVTTLTGIRFDAVFVGSCLFLKGGNPGTKRAEKGEYLTGKDFIATYNIIKDWDDIHTGNVKPLIKRQQTPFIALLHCAGILE